MSTINKIENNKKEVCQCRTCNTVFNQSEVKRVVNEHLGQTLNETVCPICGSSNYGLLDYPVDEEFNTYKSKNFHKKDKRFRYNGRKYDTSNFMFEEWN